MADNIETQKMDGYILVTITDQVISPDRAHEILSLIGDTSAKLNCKKVLLDERTVASRAISSPEIMQLNIDMEKDAGDEVFIAFLCQGRLIDRNAKLLRLFTYKNKYTIQHFSDKEQAVAWLKNR